MIRWTSSLELMQQLPHLQSRPQPPPLSSRLCLLSLLTRNGVLTAVPRSQPARWLLPMRLPLRCAPHLTSVWLRNLSVFAYTREGSMSFNRCVANMRH